MANDVTISYSDYDSSPVIDQAYFELIDDVRVTLSCDTTENSVSITMEDTISDNTELQGVLTYDKLNVFIRILSQLRNQLKSKS